MGGLDASACAGRRSDCVIRDQRRTNQPSGCVGFCPFAIGRPILACLFDLGLRRAELCNLDRIDVEARPDGRPAAIWIRGKGWTEKERMTLPDPTAAALVGWTEARGNEPGPLFHRLDGEI